VSEGHDLLEALDAIDPASVDYQCWCQIGMALKHEGHTASDWDAWSQRDVGRYRAGECFRKWDGFAGSDTPVTGGTIVSIAREHGWRPTSDDGHELDWDSTIGARDEKAIVDPAWVEAADVDEPDDWDPIAQLTRYLEVLFEANENVGYVTKSWEKDGRHLPTKGTWDRTAGELIQELNAVRLKGSTDIGAVLGDFCEEAGAWIRFNPLDGHGCKNDNVTEFRYALVESDTMPIDKQVAIIRELELPVACFVHSGGKSAHAIVHIDAADYDEYRKRVDHLYSVCKSNGLAIDAQNKNPSRLSRMPGVTRCGHKQYLIDVNIGRESYAEWSEWMEKITDDLPDPENLDTVWDNLPELAQPIIDGVLREGHKMLLAGGSKDGKSFALIELAIAIAEGREWLGWPCKKGRALYVNLEVDGSSCLHRFKNVYQALGWPSTNRKSITVWNLRGKALSMDRLAPKLIRRAAVQRYSVIIVDPLYKINGGDENSAADMTQFCNQLDVIAAELGCAIVYCHHHSKGSQGQKRSMDRASGSGVFSRDADALIDLVALDLTEDIVKQQVNEAQASHIAKFLDTRGPAGWREDVPQDSQVVADAFRRECMNILSPEVMGDLIRELEDVQRDAQSYKALRVEGTLREFRSFKPREVWFKHPIHLDDELGVLSKLSAVGDEGGRRSGGKSPSDRHKKTDAERKQERRDSLETAFDACSMGLGSLPIVELAEYMELSEKTVRRHIQEHEGFWVDGGNVGLKRETDRDKQ
jgi:RecA-family ATPase